jgi:GTP-binding protein Era
MDPKRNATEPHRAGYVALVGRPNVGKSTLLNSLLGEKVAAVSAKPQTTRNRILGIKTLAAAQVVFLDTPGIHRPHCELNRYMVEVAERAIEEVDLVHLVVAVDPRRAPVVDELDAGIAERLRATRTPRFLVVNKVDLFRRKPDLLPWIDLYGKLLDFAQVIPVSAKTGLGLDVLLSETVRALPHGPAFYPSDLYTVEVERFLAAEVVREQIFHHTREELPYAAAVTVEAWTERESRVEIDATIHVERESQKAIVIGKGGQMLRRIGTGARREISRMLGISVHLQLFVRVEPNWRRDARALRKLGYGG